MGESLMRTQDQVAAMQCPVCHVPLAMSDRQGIEIDYCPQCRGVWLDRGELDKIVERSAPDVAQPPPARRGSDRDYRPEPMHQSGGYQQGYGKPHKRRKSWLEEIFD
jgi:Zn-finger nucleic acid-binding protein